MCLSDSTTLELRLCAYAIRTWANRYLFSPLCIEELDPSDKNFKPCPCGYQVSFAPLCRAGSFRSPHLPPFRSASFVSTISGIIMQPGYVLPAEDLTMTRLSSGKLCRKKSKRAPVGVFTSF